MHGVAVSISHLTLNSCASDTEYYSNGLIGLFLIELDFVKREMSKESSFRHKSSSHVLREKKKKEKRKFYACDICMHNLK